MLEGARSGDGVCLRQGPSETRLRYQITTISILFCHEFDNRVFQKHRYIYVSYSYMIYLSRLRLYTTIILSESIIVCSISARSHPKGHLQGSNTSLGPACRGQRVCW